MYQLLRILLVLPSIAFALDLELDTLPSTALDGEEEVFNLNGEEMTKKELVRDDDGMVYLDGEETGRKEITTEVDGTVSIDGEETSRKEITTEDDGTVYLDGKEVTKKELVEDDDGNVYLDGEYIRNRNDKSIDSDFDDSSDNSQACAAIICMSDISKAFGEQCRDPIEEFFDIKEWNWKGYDAGDTFRERYKWLNECENAEDIDKKLVMMLYGVMYDMPRLPD